MRKMTALALFLYIAVTAVAQGADEELIKQTIKAEADAMVSRNVDAWQATWKHDPNAFSTFISRDGYYMRKGWDSVSAALERSWKANPKPFYSEAKPENFDIRINGNMAFAHYDVVMTPVNIQPDIFPYSNVFRMHAYETLVKEGDQWKITSIINTLPDSYNNNDHTVEQDLNNTSYQLLAAKKVNEAIEVFKLNVKLHPNAWNTYDSLGEAYAVAGNKKQAIENYEKSMKLNPKSELGPEILAKLKKQ